MGGGSVILNGGGVDITQGQNLHSTLWCKRGLLPTNINGIFQSVFYGRRGVWVSCAKHKCKGCDIYFMKQCLLLELFTCVLKCW